MDPASSPPALTRKWPRPTCRTKRRLRAMASNCKPQSSQSNHDSNEWTLVSHANSKHRRRHHGKGTKDSSKKRQPVGVAGDGGGGGTKHGALGGLYRASLDGALISRDTAKMKRDVDAADVHYLQQKEERDLIKEREQIEDAILECVHALERQVRAGRGFAFRLITALAMVTSMPSASSYLRFNERGVDDNTEAPMESTSSSGLGKVSTPLAAANEFGFMEKKVSPSDESDGSHVNNIAVCNKCETVNRSLRLRDVVAYGIGNFAKKPFSASMLQLACLLLLRRHAATTLINNHECGSVSSPHSITNASDNGCNCNVNDESITSNPFEHEQQQVPIYYYEPCILPIEKQLLETKFHIHVLETNDLGKLSVESMRQRWNSLSPSIPGCSATNSPKLSDDLHTLFYMPHCPMRLYCNVLWAHWDHICSTSRQQSTTSSTITQPETPQVRQTPTTSEVKQKNDASTCNNPIVIFGNSFRSYDDRIVSSEQRSDPTNGIFRRVEFVKEISIDGSGGCNGRSESGSQNVTGFSEQRKGYGPISRCGEEEVEEVLQGLQIAFNDCNVISLSVDDGNIESRELKKGEGGESERLDRPEEYFSSNDPNENGELI